MRYGRYGMGSGWIGCFPRLAGYPKLPGVAFIWPTYFLLISDTANAYNLGLNVQQIVTVRLI